MAVTTTACKLSSSFVKPAIKGFAARQVADLRGSSRSSELGSMRPLLPSSLGFSPDARNRSDPSILLPPPGGFSLSLAN